MNEFQDNKLYWTRKYKPVSIIDKINNASLESYIEVINNYMEIYGIKNVYSSIELNIDYCNEFVVFDDPSIIYESMDDERKSDIIHYIKRQHNCSCVLCGNTDHVVSDCNNYDSERYTSIELDEKKDIYDENKMLDTEYFDTNDITTLKEQRDYYYNLSYYWYYQMSYLYHYYEQYVYSLYNNQYNYVQII